MSFATTILRLLDQLRLRPGQTGHELDGVEVDGAGWVHDIDDRVLRVPAHPSWYRAGRTGAPVGVMWHYTATGPGTAISIARRKTRRLRPKVDRAASYHFSVSTGGQILQLVSCEDSAWHCKRGRVEQRGVNDALIGIELEGFGEDYPTQQVESARWLLGALVRHYEFPKHHVMYEHRQFDPARRADCGGIWTARHLPAIVGAVFA